MSFIRRNGAPDLSSPMTPSDKIGSPPFSFSSSIVTEHERNGWDMIGALSNVRFAVFALGSSAYPNFCNFGKYLDNLLGDLGGERLMEVTCGDELAGQEQQFKIWAAEVFRVGCDTFCLDDEAAILEATVALKTEQSASPHKVKMVKATEEILISAGLSKAHSKNVKSCEVTFSGNLHGENSSRWTQQVVFKCNRYAKDMDYQPGDHVAILPANRKSLVDFILRRFPTIEDPDEPVQIMVMKDIQTPTGMINTWEPHERLPQASVRTLLTRYLDITTPPSSYFLLLLAQHAKDEQQRDQLEQLASDPHDYEEWKHLKFPHLPEVLQEFSSVEIEPALFFSQLPLLQPRFYSISSSPLVHRGEIHLTVAVVTYRTQGGQGPLHYGVCSNYLKDLRRGQTIDCFVRSCSSFHLPKDPSRPVILVGPGTGVAPFRGFWHHRHYMMNHSQAKIGDMTLFFGCRTKALDLYPDEKEEMVSEGVLKNAYLALSREPSVPKTYVQDMLVSVGREIYRQMVREEGHFYVCGDCTMAECVYQRLKGIIQEHGKMTDQEVENYMLQMRDEDRYHEDIFGITLRTEEIHRQTRETARSKKNYSTQMSVSSSQDWS